MAEKKLLLLKPRGFCAGVVRAIDIVKIALDTFGPPIYVRKEIVHNRYVVEDLQAKGAIFVDEIAEVPEGERVIYSAHGVAPEVRDGSHIRKLRVIDATCPLVTKVHVEAVKFAKHGYSLILIGHRDHDEGLGTLGEAPEVTQVVGSAEEVQSLEVPDPNRVAYLTQTTLSLDETRDIIEALKKKYPKAEGPAAQDICYATENRQTAVKHIVNEVDLLLVVGSDNSSNSKRLVEVARDQGREAHLIGKFRAVRAGGRPTPRAAACSSSRWPATVGDTSTRPATPAAASCSATGPTSPTIPTSTPRLRPTCTPLGSTWMSFALCARIGGRP